MPKKGGSELLLVWECHCCALRFRRPMSGTWCAVCRMEHCPWCILQYNTPVRPMCRFCFWYGLEAIMTNRTEDISNTDAGLGVYKRRKCTRASQLTAAGPHEALPAQKRSKVSLFDLESRMAICPPTQPDKLQIPQKRKVNHYNCHCCYYRFPIGYPCVCGAKHVVSRTV